MARTSKVDEQNVDDALETEENFTPDDLAIMNMLEDLGGDSTAGVRIYRQGATYQDITLMHECAPAEFQPMMLAHPPFNGGNFRIHVRSKGGFVANRMLKVSPSSAALEDIARTKAGYVAPATSVVLPPQAPSQDMLPVIAKMMEGFQSTVLTMMQNMRPEKENPMQTLEGITKIAALMKPEPVAPVVQQDGFEKTMRSVALFLDTQSKLNPAKLTDSDGELSMAGVALAALKEFREMQSSKPAPVVAGNAQLPAPATTITPEQEEDEEMNIMLRIQLKAANRAAKAGQNAKEYAEFIYPMIPDSLIAMLADNAQWFDLICVENAECAQYKAWYMELAKNVLLQASEDGLLQPETPPATVTHGDNNGGSTTATT